jgi:hypothetical protein
MSMSKAIIVDACVSPASTIPVGVGGTILMGAWAFSLGPFIAFLGVAGILAGIGIGITNLLVRYPEYAKKHVMEQRKKQREERDRQLDILDRRLIKDRDPKDQEALRSLRDYYNLFLDDLFDEKLPKEVSQKTLDSLEDVFSTCVKSLEFTADLWDALSTTRGEERKKLIAERNLVIDDVVSRVDRFGERIADIRTLGLRAKKGDLDSAQEKLDRNLRVAKRVEERMSELKKQVRIEPLSE